MCPISEREKPSIADEIIQRRIREEGRKILRKQVERIIGPEAPLSPPVKKIEIDYEEATKMGETALAEQRALLEKKQAERTKVREILKSPKGQNIITQAITSQSERKVATLGAVREEMAKAQERVRDQTIKRATAGSIRQESTLGAVRREMAMSAAEHQAKAAATRVEAAKQELAKPARPSMRERQEIIQAIQEDKVVTPKEIEVPLLTNLFDDDTQAGLSVERVVLPEAPLTRPALSSKSKELALPQPKQSFFGKAWGGAKKFGNWLWNGKWE